jgi:hypothetical protein
MAETSQISPHEASDCWERLFDVQNKWESWRYTVDPGDLADSYKLFRRFRSSFLDQTIGRIAPSIQIRHSIRASFSPCLLPSAKILAQLCPVILLPEP